MPIKVKATREGLPGRRTSSGYVIDRYVSFAALPSTLALHHFIRITNPLNGKSTLAQVLDVGPWNEHDDEYVFGGNRPQAETGLDEFGRTTNKAAIDLSDRVWVALDMQDNTEVEWEFIS